MPKGKASAHRQQAGTAAVPTTSTQADKAAEYKRLCAAFSTALRNAGADSDLREEADCVWRACCSADARSKSMPVAIYMPAVILAERCPSGSLAKDLASLFLRRILLLADTFSVVLQYIHQHQQHIKHEELFMCIYILGSVLSSFSPPSKAHLELWPPPDQSPAVLVRKLWTPQFWTAVCHALLRTSDKTTRNFPTFHLQDFLFVVNPTMNKALSEDVAAENGAATWAGLDAILTDSTCMSATWEVLEHRKHAHVAAHTLGFLVQMAPTVGPGCPASLRHLLRMGAERPLVAALTHYSKKLDERPQVRHQAETEEPTAVLISLLNVVMRASTEDMHRPSRRERATEAPWPRALLQAHLLALIKVAELQPIQLVGGSHMFYGITQLLAYPPTSLPTVASVLASHPDSLRQLVSFLGRYAAAIPTAKAEAIEACKCFSFFFIDLLEAGSPKFEQALPVQLLTANALAALQNAATVLMQPPWSLQKITPGNAGDEVHFYSLGGIAELQRRALLLRGSTELSAFSANFKLAVGQLVAGAGAVSLADLASGGKMSAGAGAAKQSGPVRACLACGRLAKGLKACGRCGAVFFCDQSCQRSAWGSHRAVCAPK